MVALSDDLNRLMLLLLVVVDDDDVTAVATTAAVEDDEDDALFSRSFPFPCPVRRVGVPPSGSFLLYVRGLPEELPCTAPGIHEG